MYRLFRSQISQQSTIFKIWRHQSAGNENKIPVLIRLMTKCADTEKNLTHPQTSFAFEDSSMWQFSIRSKIILTLLLTGLACLAAGALIGYRAGETALTRSVEEQLMAQREIKRRWIENYVNDQLRFTAGIAGLPETTEATKAFIAAYREMRTEAQANPAATQADSVALEAWYNKDLLPRLDRIAGSHTPLEGLMPADPVARRLQADYIARNPNPVGQKDKLLAAPDAFLVVAGQLAVTVPTGEGEIRLELVRPGN
jgi:hypothetical protein